MAEARLELHVLRSGDHGVCTVVRDTLSGTTLAVDCGISGQTFAGACKDAGINPFKVDAVLITHGHGNQVKGLKSTLAWLAKRGVEPDVYVEPGVLAQTPSLQELQEASRFKDFYTKQPFCVGDILVRPFRTFHNNEDKGGCYNFRFEAGEGGACDVIAMLSDAGVLSREAQSEMGGARVLAVEANYDPRLLETAAQANKAVRFAVDTRGNFSNAQAAAVVRTYAWDGLEDVVVMYVSRQYNTPRGACEALQGALDQVYCPARVTCTSPDDVVSVMPGTFVRPRNYEVLLSPEEVLAQGLLAKGALCDALAGCGACMSQDIAAALVDCGLVEESDGMPTAKALRLGAWAAYEVLDGTACATAVFPQDAVPAIADELRNR